MSLGKKIKDHFLSASALEKKLFIQAFFYALIVRVFMLKVKYQRYEKRLGQRGVESSFEYPQDKDFMVKTIRTVVMRVCKNTPWESKCMVQALTAKWLYKKYHIPSTIYFGIKNDPENKGSIKAHAWLRVGDLIATGKSGSRSFNVVNFYS